MLNIVQLRFLFRGTLLNIRVHPVNFLQNMPFIPFTSMDADRSEDVVDVTVVEVDSPLEPLFLHGNIVRNHRRLQQRFVAKCITDRPCLDESLHNCRKFLSDRIVKSVRYIIDFVHPAPDVLFYSKLLLHNAISRNIKVPPIVRPLESETVKRPFEKILREKQLRAVAAEISRGQIAHV